MVIFIRPCHRYAPVIAKTIKYDEVCWARHIRMEEKWKVYKILWKELFAKPSCGKLRRMKDRVKMELGDI